MKHPSQIAIEKRELEREVRERMEMSITLTIGEWQRIARLLESYAEELEIVGKLVSLWAYEYDDVDEDIKDANKYNEELIKKIVEFEENKKGWK
jgi:hypothetical protein